MNEEVMPVGTQRRLAELEQEVERLRALNGELLDALRAMLDDDDHDEAKRKARAAIARAEGQR